MEQAETCRFIQKLGAGVNNIDLETASNRGIPVSMTKGGNARSVAEHAVALMMMVFKQMNIAHNEIVNKGTHSRCRSRCVRAGADRTRTSFYYIDQYGAHAAHRRGNRGGDA